MIIAVSPYHLTTREAPAMAALLLATRVVTMLPAPVDASGGAGGLSPLQTASRIPSYRRFVESWAWTVPLWEQGVLQFSHAGQATTDELTAVSQHIDDDDACLPLRHFMRRHEFPDAGAFLSAVAADLLKGGPDPGISVPVAAGLDRFAARHGLVVARSRASSLAQQAEAKLGPELFQVAVPILQQATAARLVHYRETLSTELAALASVVARVSDRVHASTGDEVGGGGQSLQRDVAALESAAGELTLAAVSQRDELLMGAHDDEVRVVEGTAILSGAALPWDAALTSSVRALDALHGGARRTTREAVAEAPNATALAKRDALRGRRFLALVVRPMGQHRSH